MTYEQGFSEEPVVTNLGSSTGFTVEIISVETGSQLEREVTTQDVTELEEPQLVAADQFDFQPSADILTTGFFEVPPGIETTRPVIFANDHEEPPVPAPTPAPKPARPRTGRVLDLEQQINSRGAA